MGDGIGFDKNGYLDKNALISSAQAFTDAWADLGGEINCFDKDRISLWLTLDVNDDSDLRVRALALHTSGGTEHYFPIATVGTSDIAVEDEYIEFTNDGDESYVLQWELNKVIPFIQFQVMRGTDGGGTDAEVDAASYVLR